MKRIVVALGGNALGNTPDEQIKIVGNTAKKIVDLVEMGHEIIITHGNGPQVGMIFNGMYANQNVNNGPYVPLTECGAMSQGYIGYHLQQAIQRELKKRNIKKDCVTVVTQVEVDKKDIAFENPTKPIGPFYSKKEADKMSQKTGGIYKEDAGRGYRKVVPSPLPRKIVELKAISKLVHQGNVVISCGGGGIPVIKRYDRYEGIEAVIDKDRTSARLAIELNADILLILTAIDYACINFGKPNQQKLHKVDIKTLKGYLARNEFAKGSMLPKVESCITFVKHKNKKSTMAIITSLSKAKESIMGRTGTIIYKE